MKKLLLFIMVAASVMFISCNSCNSGNQTLTVKDSTKLVPAMSVEHTIALDRENVYLNYDTVYMWFQTAVKFEKNFDAEDTDAAITEIHNLFQTLEYAIWYHHAGDSTTVETLSDRWMGNSDMSKCDIKLTFTDAYNRMQESDIIKPNSNECVLCREVGDLSYHPQYIFGAEEIYVDAVTGEVRNENPY